MTEGEERADMSGEIAAAAKTWLTEPRYAVAFKLTTDVLKDYLCNVREGFI